MRFDCRFVEDGCIRARSAMEVEIRRAVELEFQERLEVHVLWRRFLVRLQMKREIRRRLVARAPVDAHY